MVELEIKSITVGKWKVNTYFLILNKDVWVIDPGDDFDELEAIIDTNNYTVLGILLTHGHFDHISSAQKIKERYKVKIYLHSKDKRVVRQANLFRKLAGGRDTQPTPIIDHYLDEYNSLSFADSKDPLKIHHIPGHSPGSVCFELDDNLFVGDIFFYNKIGRTDMPGGDSKELKESIQFLTTQFFNFKIHPGHGESFILNKERKELILDIINGDTN